MGCARDARQPRRRVRRRDALHQQERAPAAVGDRVLARRGPAKILGRILAALPQGRRRPALSQRARRPRYNRNQDSHAIENVVRWYDYWRERPGTGARVSSGGVNIIFSDTNTHYRGAENYRRSGEVDAMRIPKDGYFAHQVMWDGWVDVERPRTHIIGHWNYAAGTRKNVYVVSSGRQGRAVSQRQVARLRRAEQPVPVHVPDVSSGSRARSTPSATTRRAGRSAKPSKKTAGDPPPLRLTRAHRPARPARRRRRRGAGRRRGRRRRGQPLPDRART